MKILVGRRRLVSYRYGWRIEIEVTKKDGSKEWREDAPAYPANLSSACETLLERIFIDTGDTTIGKMPERLRLALKELKKCIESARRSL